MILENLTDIAWTKKTGFVYKKSKSEQIFMYNMPLESLTGVVWTKKTGFTLVKILDKSL